MRSLKIPVFFLAAGIWFWTCGVGKAQSLSQGVLQELVVYPSVIVYNAKIYTMDKNLSTSQAMAVRGSRIWKLGSNDEIRRLAGPQTQLIDAKGRAVVPGLRDAHTHPQLWGMMHHGHKYDQQLQWLYVEGNNVDEVKSRLGEAVQKRIQQAGADKWVVVSIPRELAQEALGGGITREFLDRVAPNTPVAMMTGITGQSLNNTKAKEQLERRLGWEVTGLPFWYKATYDIILANKLKEAADLLAEELSEWLPFGVTGFMAHIESPQTLRALQYLDRQGKMPTRWAWIHRIGFALGKDPAEFYSLLGDFVGQGSEYLWNAGIGEEGSAMIQGTGWSGGCNSAVRRSGTTQSCQNQIFPGTRAYEAHLAAARAGLRLANIHTSGDMALDAAFQIAETVIREGAMTLEEIRQQRWSFDHGSMLRPEQAILAAKYGFWLTFQPMMGIGREEGVLQEYGPKYVPWVVPVKAWLDAGARFVLSTDMHVAFGQSHEEAMQDQMLGKSLWGTWPDELRNSIWPQLGMWVTREMNGKVYSPEKKLDRTTVMKAWTIWPAEDVLREKEMGSLEPGKLADFIMIDKDYFTIPEREINSIKTMMTAVGGQVKFKATNF